jgi:hypothetical protein
MPYFAFPGSEKFFDASFRMSTQCNCSRGLKMGPVLSMLTTNFSLFLFPALPIQQMR